MSRPQSRHVRVDPTNPEGAGRCDLCGRWYQLRTLRAQQEWAGTHLYTFKSLRCEECWDIPQEQFRTIILPPDPPPLLDARVPDFQYEEQTVMIAQFGAANEPPWGAGPQTILCTQDGETALVLQYLTSS